MLFKNRFLIQVERVLIVYQEFEQLCAKLFCHVENVSNDVMKLEKDIEIVYEQMRVLPPNKQHEKDLYLHYFCDPQRMLVCYRLLSSWFSKDHTPPCLRTLATAGVLPILLLLEDHLQQDHQILRGGTRTALHSELNVQLRITCTQCRLSSAVPRYISSSPHTHQQRPDEQTPTLRSRKSELQVPAQYEI